MRGQQVGRGGAPGLAHQQTGGGGGGGRSPARRGLWRREGRGGHTDGGGGGRAYQHTGRGGGAGQERGDTPPHSTAHCRCRRGSRGTELKIYFKQDKTILVLNGLNTDANFTFLSSSLPSHIFNLMLLVVMLTFNVQYHMHHPSGWQTLTFQALVSDGVSGVKTF